MFEISGSRLTYALQSDRLTGRQCRTVDSVWMRMLRSMVRCGFARNGPDLTRFTLPNASILSACNTWSASSFCQQQHLRYLTHVCRMENDALQKQLLFAPPRKKEVSHWKRLANALRQEGGKRVATGNTWRTLTADMPVQQHE